MSIVMKFGGSSVATARDMERAATLVESSLDQAPVVVVSAIAGVTNSLSEIPFQSDAARTENRTHLESIHMNVAEDLFGKPLPPGLDDAMACIFDSLDSDIALLRATGFDESVAETLLTYGERLVLTLFATYLFQRHCDLRRVDARQVIRLNALGAVDTDATRTAVMTDVRPLVRPGRAVLLEGFIAGDVAGRPCTLGRDGSDYTAALLARFLDAEKLEIWTDVPGVFTHDPRLEPEARWIPEMTFEDALDLVEQGASVLHARAIEELREAGIPIRVRSCRDPAGDSTLIHLRRHSS